MNIFFLFLMFFYMFFMMMMTARVKLLKYFNWTKVGTIYQNLPRYSLVSFFCCSFFPYIPCRCFFNGCHFFFCILFPNILIAIIIISITNVLTGFKTLYSFPGKKAYHYKKIIFYFSLFSYNSLIQIEMEIDTLLTLFFSVVLLNEC